MVKLYSQWSLAVFGMKFQASESRDFSSLKDLQEIVKKNNNNNLCVFNKKKITIDIAQLKKKNN